jgi:hypothetical protein
MRFPLKLVLTSAGAAAVLAAVAVSAQPRSSRSDQALIRSAVSAAPRAVGARAAVVVANPDGTMRSLRAGNNGFTCMPDNPATPGPDPMCMDSNAMGWAMAWISHRPPPADRVGLMYMLAGGTDASNTDPYAERPTSANHWVNTGPHLMVVGAPSLLTNYPSGAAPDTSQPYVMWPGTPYAHLMIPVR